MPETKTSIERDVIRTLQFARELIVLENSRTESIAYDWTDSSVLFESNESRGRVSTCVYDRSAAVAR